MKYIERVVNLGDAIGDRVDNRVAGSLFLRTGSSCAANIHLKGGASEVLYISTTRYYL